MENPHKDHSKVLSNNTVVERYTSGEGYKMISLALKIPRSTVKFMVKKWNMHGTTHSLSKSGCPSKLDDREWRHLVWDATRKQMATLKNLQDFIANRGKCLHPTTISKILHTSGLYGILARRKPFDKKSPSGVAFQFQTKTLEWSCRKEIGRRFCDQMKP